MRTMRRYYAEGAQGTLGAPGPIWSLGAACVSFLGRLLILKHESDKI